MNLGKLSKTSVALYSKAVAAEDNFKRVLKGLFSGAPKKDLRLLIVKTIKQLVMLYKEIGRD